MTKANKDAAQESTKKKKKSRAGKVKGTRITQNGIVRPKPGTLTGIVWKHADQISQQCKEPAKRGDVLDASIKEGVNPATAATQYGRWCKFNGVATERAARLQTTSKEEAAKEKPEPKPKPEPEEAPEESFDD